MQGRLRKFPGFSSCHNGAALDPEHAIQAQHAKHSLDRWLGIDEGDDTLGLGHHFLQCQQRVDGQTVDSLNVAHVNVQAMRVGKRGTMVDFLLELSGRTSFKMNLFDGNFQNRPGLMIG